MSRIYYKIITFTLKIYWYVVPYNYRPSHIWDKVTSYAWHRHTTIKPRYLGHTLIKEKDLLPHSMFEIFSKFVEKNKSKYPDQNTLYEMTSIYNWWHKEYIPNIDHVFDHWHAHNDKYSLNAYFPEDNQENNQLDEKIWEDNDFIYCKSLKKQKYLENELNNKLHRIIDILQKGF